MVMWGQGCIAVVGGTAKTIEVSRNHCGDVGSGLQCNN